MNPLRLLCVGHLTMLFTATPCHAGLDLGWDDCITDSGVIDRILPCADVGIATLYASFQLDNAVNDFVALEFSLDLQTFASPSGDFWQFGSGECNDGALILSHGRFAQCLSAHPTMCAITGSQCQDGFAWATQFTGPSRHRLVGSVFRDHSQPVALAASTNYFAFRLEFFTINAVEGGGGTCVGCDDKASIVWNAAVASGLAADEPIEGPGLVGNCIGLNGGGSGLCGGSPTQNTTWGQIKSLYR